MGSKSARRLRNLFSRDRRCFWCGVTTIMIVPRPSVLPDNHATVDHLRSRFDPTRWKKNRQRHERTVLACYRCNHRRGAEEQAVVPNDELRRRSREGLRRKKSKRPPRLSKTVEPATFRLGEILGPVWKDFKSSQGPAGAVNLRTASRERESVADSGISSRSPRGIPDAAGTQAPVTV